MTSSLLLCLSLFLFVLNGAYQLQLQGFPQPLVQVISWKQVSSYDTQHHHHHHLNSSSSNHE